MNKIEKKRIIKGQAEVGGEKHFQAAEISKCKQLVHWVRNDLDKR